MIDRTVLRLLASGSASFIAGTDGVRVDLKVTNEPPKEVEHFGRIDVIEQLPVVRTRQKFARPPKFLRKGQR